MEVRNTPPRPPLPEWDDSSVLEEMCLALRDVGVANPELPDGEYVRIAVTRAKALGAELIARGIDPKPRLERLSSETGWDTVALYRDTLAFPDAVPYLETTPEPTCGNCGCSILRRATIGLCKECLIYGIDLLRSGGSESHLETCTICERQERGFLVYAKGLEWMNYCHRCLEEERARLYAA